MDDLHPRRGPAVTLQREVETPQRQPSGLGVMLLASAAMFFAVAGSAFILRARMTGSGCPYQREGSQLGPTRAQDELRPAPADRRFAQPPPDCVRSHTAADGSQVVEFRVCP